MIQINKECRPVVRYSLYSFADLMFSALVTGIEVKANELANYEEALRSDDSNKWKKAMDEEMSSLMKNETCTLIPKPVNCKPMKCKWIFKVKEGTSNSELVR